MTTTGDTLRELAEQVRSGTLQLLEGVPEDWLLYAPPGTSNHMLWHAGHALWLQDLLCVELLTGRSQLPQEWADRFGMNCRPVKETSDWPTQTELAHLLRRQLERITELLTGATEAQLSQIANPARGPAAVSARIIHGFHDEAKHCGEMYLLLKLCRAQHLPNNASR